MTDVTDSIINNITIAWRQRQTLINARTKLILQCKAVCRSQTGGDKDDADKLWNSIEKGGSPDILTAMTLNPLIEAMDPLNVAIKDLEKKLKVSVKSLPLWNQWGIHVRGLGEISFAGVIGELNGMPNEYRSVAAVWKRFGLSVEGGERQRRVANNPELAIKHGYNARRRSHMYVIGTCMIKASKDKEGNITQYRSIYDLRKNFELEKGLTLVHAHNRAMRYMTKELLRHAWLTSRRL